MTNTLSVSNELTPTQRASIEADIIDDLCAWKVSEDNRATCVTAARAAVAKAKELQIWVGKYHSFKDWLAGECDITEQWAYRLVNSARMIYDIQKVAKENKKLAELNKLEVKAALENLPVKATEKLNRISTANAAMAALNAIQVKKGITPTPMEVEKEIVKLSAAEPFVAPVRKGPSKQHPILTALDQEWELLKLDAPRFKLKPEMIYTRLRVAVEDAL